MSDQSFESPPKPRLATVLSEQAKLIQRVIGDGLALVWAGCVSRMQIGADPHPQFAQMQAVFPQRSEQTGGLLAQERSLSGTAGRDDHRVAFNSQRLNRKPHATGIEDALQSHKTRYALHELSKAGLLIQPFDR